MRNVRQVCEGGVRRFGMSRETVRSATWKPSFSSSPWILGAPQRGLAAVIRVTRAAISGLTGGRPRVGRPESLVQCSRKPAPLPPQNGVGSNDHKRLSPPGPDPGQRHPGKPISRAELRPGRRSLVDGELLVQGEVFEGELAVAAARKGQEAKQLEQEGDDRTRIFAGSEPADQPLPAGLNFGEGQAAGSPPAHRGPGVPALPSARHRARSPAAAPALRGPGSQHLPRPLPASGSTRSRTVHAEPPSPPWPSAMSWRSGNILSGSKSGSRSDPHSVVASRCSC